MAEYINRFDLINRIYQYAANHRIKYDPQTEEIFRAIIESIPSADVQPVKHGRWDGYGRCTACGMFWDEMRTMDGDDTGYWYEMPPYCNNCGAKMDGEENV